MKVRVMSTQYRCQNPGRLQEVRNDPNLNAIDYLEVLDQNAPTGSPRQQTLLVHCLKPIPALRRDNVRIEGGVRITPVNVVWAYPAKSIPASLVTPQEQTYFTGLADADNVLVVRTDSTGDYSLYTLMLTKSETNLEPPDKFDLLLSQVTFTFKVECPNDFDCKPEEVCPPEKLPEPQIDYLAKDYASFRRLMLDRLSILVPDWQERNPADLGVALVETLAYAGDYLSYYQEAVATEAYLGTARKRISVRRHARLLDYTMHEGCNARTWVHLEVEKGSPADGAIFPAGTPLLTQTNAPRGALLPVNMDAAIQEGAQVFETLHDLTLLSNYNTIIQFYTWGDDACCLPKGATQATLQGSATDLPLQEGDVLIFEEYVGPTTGLKADADPSHRYVVRLDKTPVERTDPLNNTKVLDISWFPEDALPFPLCLWQVDTGIGSKVPASVARGNVVLADYGQSIPGEALVPDTVPAEGFYKPQLQRGDITQLVTYDHASAKTQAASLAVTQDPRQALPAVTLYDGSDNWFARRDLLESNPFDRDFVAEIDEGGLAHLRFGDGALGEMPEVGAQFTATYRVGNGRAGNIGAEAIANVVTTLAGIVTVRNPLPAQGGTDSEPLEQVRLYAPEAFRIQERAVTEADYAEVAERHPQVQKAVATLRWTGSWYTMFLTVDRMGGLPVDADFKVEMQSFLNLYRLAGHDVDIESPIYVPLDILMTVCVAPGYFRDAVKKALLETFSNRDLPDGRRGFFHPDNFTFGQPVYLSQVVAAIMRTPGVLWVDTDDTPPKLNHFLRWGQAARGELADGKIRMGRLEIARLDNDSSLPENGKIDFGMVGGL